ncbi:MAG: hypothetical protein ACSHYF_17505 [Verrucomicrobiaceae bacterium]
MKIIPTIILAAALPLAAQITELPDGPGQETPPIAQTYDFDFKDTTLEDVFGRIKTTVPNAPNVVFKGNAQAITITMRLRNVTLENFKAVIQEVTECQVREVDSNPNDNSPGVLVITAPSLVSQAPTLTPAFGGLSAPGGASGLKIDLLPGTAPSDSPGASGPFETPPISRTYPLGGNEKTPPRDIMDAITALWQSSHPEWTASEGKKAFALHEPTRLLIVRAPEARQIEAAIVIDQLSESTKGNKEIDNIKAMAAREIERRERDHDHLEHQLARAMAEIQERDMLISKLKAEFEALKK